MTFFHVDVSSSNNRGNDNDNDNDNDDGGDGDADVDDNFFGSADIAYNYLLRRRIRGVGHLDSCKAEAATRLEAV